MPKGSRSTQTPWHHGALREAVIRAAYQLVVEGGAQAVTLRALVARIPKREGSDEVLSHTAPMAHFGSITEILTEVATLGWQRLLEELTPEGVTRVDRLVSLGVRYRDFAYRNRLLFRVMYDERIWSAVDAYSPDPAKAAHFGTLPIGDASKQRDALPRFRRIESLREIQNARDAAFERFKSEVEADQASSELRSGVDCSAVMAARVIASLSHGLAMEAIDEQLPEDEVRPILRIAAEGLRMCKYTQTPAPDEQANPRSRRGLVGAGAVRSRALLGGAEQGAEFTEPVALAVDVNDRDVMQ